MRFTTWVCMPTTLGTPLDHKRVRNEFKSILKQAGLPAIRFHDLRHTSLNALLDMGLPVNTVQGRAGHAKASTTVNIYGHATARLQTEAAEKIEELITPVQIQLQ
jgi:integrase